MNRKKSKGRNASLAPAVAKTESDAVAKTATQNTKASNEFSMAKMISFGLLLAVIVLLGIMFYRVMAGFLVPMFLAALLVVIFEPFHQWFVAKCKGRESLAAGLTTLSIMLTVLVPIGLLFVLAVAEGQALFKQYRSPQIAQSLVEMRKSLGLDMPLSDQFRRIESRFESLHSQLELDEMEKQGLGLSEIDQNAAEVADNSDLTWPPADTDSDEGVGSRIGQLNSTWAAFYQHLSQARRIENAATWKLPKDHEDIVEIERQRHLNLREYQKELNEADTQFDKFKTQFQGGRIRSLFTQVVNPSSEQIESYANSALQLIRNSLPKLGGATSAFLGNLLIGTAIMVFSLYFFLLDGERMVKSIQGLSPLDDDHETELIDEFGRVSRAVVVATLLSALAQGILAGIGFYFCGLESIFLLTLLSAVLAMVPFVGAASVWLPCCLYLYFVDQNVTAAIGLAVYGVAVISMADNVIKPLVLHGQSNLHPLLALLSVIGGVSTLGPIGILIGPMVVVFLQTLLKILRRELDGIENGFNSSPEVS